MAWYCGDLYRRDELTISRNGKEMKSMKQIYEAPSILLVTVSEDDILTLSLNRGNVEGWELDCSDWEI